MLIAAIAIILLVVGGVGTMSVVMQENAEVADELVAVSVHTHERGQEEVDVTRDSGGLKLLNAGPEIEILEYRVLDGAGTLMKSCPASLDVGASQRKTVDSTEQELKGCWDEYDDPTELFQVVTARGKVFTLEESGSGNSTIINNIITPPQNVSGVGAGALGTSGRMVSVPLNGHIVYGADQGKPGVIQEATTFNYYTGSIDHVGFIPSASVPTRYSLESPYGQYYVASSGLEPITGTPVNVNVVASKVLEGSAPVVRNYGNTVEVNVNGNALVQLDETNFNDRVVIGVDAGNVVAQVVTSPNDLVNTNYQDFNGTGKFVLFEGQAQYGSLNLKQFESRWECRDDVGDRSRTCRNDDFTYNVQWYNTNRGYDLYRSYADNQRALPSMLDVYVSNVDESFSDSDTTLTVKYGHKASRSQMSTSRASFDGIYATNSTFVGGLWHMTQFWEEEAYSIQ